jgi:transposase
MLSISSHVRVFLARSAVDMRKSFHGLLALTESVLAVDPLSGHLFMFVNRRRDRIKLLYWGGTGFCIWYQQLESGTYQLPDASGADAQQGLEITACELSLILDGIDLTSVRRRTRYELRRPKLASPHVQDPDPA